MPRTEIRNTDDVIDSRDVIARLNDLESDRDTLQGAADDETLDADARVKAQAALAEWALSDDGQEFKYLEALHDDAEGYAPDWKYGATLIRESYFVEYCEELCADIGDLPKDLPGYLVIDWRKTAENLKADYTSVEFDGVTYLVR